MWHKWKSLPPAYVVHRRLCFLRCLSVHTQGGTPVRVSTPLTRVGTHWSGQVSFPARVGTPWVRVGTPSQGGYPPARTDQHSEHLLRGRRYASCIHAGGLSC